MRRILSISLALMALISLAWVVAPVALMLPFKPQTPSGLAASHALVTRSGWITLLLLVLGVIAAALLWRRLASWWGRALAVLAVVILAGGAYMGRQSTFESMFHPLLNPEFAAADQAKDVAEDDLVLGVAIGDQARAYPVRAMAYHHLVNDVVAGEPIVATY